MHVSLTPKLEQLVRRKVKSGQYNNASEVVREALRFMAARDEAERAKLKRLREAVISGINSGMDETFSFERLNRELDEEADREGLADG